MFGKMKRNTQHRITLCSLLAIAAPFLGAAAQAQSTLPPAAESARVDCADAADAECAARRKRKQDEERANRATELGSPQAVGDAPLPPQGQPTPKPVITRGPLTVRRVELSAGVDHALSPQWVLGGLVGLSRARLHRFQSELPPNSAPGSLPTESDTTVRPRGTTLAVTLTHYPRDDVFIDATVSALRTSFDVDRLVNDAVRFTGNNRGRAVGLSLTAGGVWRYTGLAVVPQAGLDYVVSRVDPLHTSYTFIDTGDGPFEGFAVSAQRQKALSALAGVQLQWARSAAFGTVTPYVRTALRQRLSLHGDAVVATAPAAIDVVTDPQLQSSKRGLTVAGGVLAQFPGGTSLFADLGVARGEGQLRETRLAMGIKFER
jgi:Autotransporter beta-domain